MRKLIILLLLSINCFSQQKITLSVGVVTDFSGKLVNSTLPSGWTATRSTGFNEFSIINADDGTDDYELFFDDRFTTRYVRFHDANDLQGLVGTELTIGSGFHYPKAMKIDGRYYVYYYNFGDSKNYLIQGNTISELQSATPLDIGISGVADFRAMQAIGGGYIGVGQSNQARIFTAPNPEGPWTDQGYVFAPDPSNPYQLLNPMYAVNHADPQMYYKNGRLFLVFNGISFDHQNYPPISHQCTVEINQSTYRAIGRPIEFIHCYDRSFHYVDNDIIGPYQAVANPRYINIQGREEMWYMGGTKGTYDHPDTGSIAHYTISTTGALDAGGLNNVVNVVAGQRVDLAHNVTHTYYGTVSNTSSGISTSTNNSGLWNFVSTGNLISFNLSVSFTVNTLPVSGVSTVFHVIPNYKGINTTEKCELWLYVNTDGTSTLKFIDYGGTEQTFSTGSVSLGVQKTVTLSVTPSGGGYNFSINGGAPVFSLNGMGQSAIYSLLNDGTDLIAPGNQMYGSIQSFSINLQ
jgi:hypothetical protein